MENIIRQPPQPPPPPSPPPPPPPPPSPPPPTFRLIPRNNLQRLIRPPPPPPPPPPFRSIPRSFPLGLIRKQPPPPPPQLPPFGPRFPLRNLILTRKYMNRRKRLMHKEYLTWYSLTFMMRQKLHKPPEEWVITIKEKMEQVLREDATTSWDKHCIYRVPHHLQANDRKSYFPQTVSLGPYHHGKKDLLPMDHHKWRAANMVMKRTKQSIEMYINAMEKLETRARACYEGSIGMSSNEFIKMLILDGCFVLELFRGAYKENGFLELGYNQNDPVFAMRASLHTIQRDMVMLENQLPLFVLNRLLELQLGSRNQTGLVAQLAARFFDPLMPTDEPLTQTNQSNLEYSLATNKAFDPFVMNSLGDKSGLHCLDAFRRSLLQSSTKTYRSLPQKRGYGGLRVVDKRKKQMIPCVTELRDGGIKFKKRDSERFWDIGFSKGYLEVPKLFIHDGTKSLFLNLIAFEQSHMASSNDITAYIVFMDNLIDSPEDVSHLRSCGIIEHWLESDSEVADLFNRIGQETIFDIKDGYLVDLSIEAKRYYLHHNKYYRKWNGAMKTLKEKYFDSPWGYISFFAALILLFLTSSQSYFAAYSYYKPPP